MLVEINGIRDLGTQVDAINGAVNKLNGRNQLRFEENDGNITDSCG